MNKFRLGFVLTANYLLLVLPASAGTCEKLVTFEFPNATIAKAELVTGGSFTPLNDKPITNLPDFCRVTAVLRPSADSDIRVEIWMPRSGWNERLLGTGNGGFAGNIYYGALAEGLRLGYAVVNTDMGMSVPAGSDASIFVGRPERWVDFGYRSTHEMTVVAKRLVKAYYEREAQKSYFLGCSTGGEQALMEAQRFPRDYDGIAGGAPANNRTGVHINILWNFVVTHRSPKAYIPPAKLRMLENAVLAACDELDGVKDGLIADPRKCHVDPASLRCKSADSDSCLTAPQVETARLLYSGPKNPRTHQALYPGIPRGSEFGWDYYFGPSRGSVAEPPFAPIFKWVFGSRWDWHSFDFDRQATIFDSRLAPSVNATSPDLDEFRRLGHKLLMYHGWADWLVAPEESITYWNSVLARYQAQRRQAHDSAGKIDDFYRLFMVPGMGHCGGGPGPDSLDPLSAVVNWVEHVVAPDRIIAAKYANDQSAGVIFQRPLCPYPQLAQYRGAGAVNDAASYACKDPDAVLTKRQEK